MVNHPDRDNGPLEALEDWEDDLRRRYPPPPNEFAPGATKTKDAFRDYRAEAKPGVKEFYRLNHTRKPWTSCGKSGPNTCR